MSPMIHRIRIDDAPSVDGRLPVAKEERELAHLPRVPDAVFWAFLKAFGGVTPPNLDLTRKQQMLDTKRSGGALVPFL